MKAAFSVKNFLFFCLLVCWQWSFSSPADSTNTVPAKADTSATVKARKPSTMNDTWFHGFEPEVHTVIDSTIYKIQEYNVIQREGIEYENLGNTGTAAFPLVFTPDRTLGFNLGYNQFDIYKYQLDSVKYYKVVRPYVEVSLGFGMNYEQVFTAKLANNHKDIVSYGVDFTRLFSTGTYASQKANDNGFSLYSIFNSKNRRWNAKADLLFNSFKVSENGGVATNPFDSSFFKKNLVPINDSSQNNYRDLNFYFTTSYNVGPKYSQRKNDTLVVKEVLPVFKVSHQLNIEHQSLQYRDYYPDTFYYDKFYLPDSVYNNLTLTKVGNAAILEYRPRKLTSDSTYEEKDFIAYAEAGFDYFWLKQDTAHHSFGDLYVGGTFRNNFASKPKIIYRASAKYYVYGYNLNDLLVDGIAGYNFGKIGIVTGNATYEIKRVPYIYQHYDYEPDNWNYKLPQTKILDLGGKYQNPLIGFVADLNYYVADHLPTLPGLAYPFVSSNEENAFVAHAGNRNQIKGLHIDNDIWYTAATKNGYIYQMYPMLVTKTSIYYERRVFKDAFWFATGFDLRIRYKNNAPYYDPLLGAFVPESLANTANPLLGPQVSLNTYPVLDFFFNFKIKTVRIFLKVSNISSEFGPGGYYALYGYPAADIAFMAGITWRFFE